MADQNRAENPRPDDGDQEDVTAHGSRIEPASEAKYARTPNDDASGRTGAYRTSDKAERLGADDEPEEGRDKSWKGV